MRRARLSLAEARRVVLAAQGFDRPRPARPDLRHLRSTVRRLGLLQLDYVNAVLPAHYLVPFSRLGPYRREQLDELAYRRRELTEQWAHEASIVPMETWPLLAHRRAAHRPQPAGFEAFMARHRDYVAAVLAAVAARGPLTADELPAPAGAERRLEHAWFGSVPRAVLEAHFGRGALAVAERRPNFARAYDLAERIVPARHRHRQPARHEAERELLRQAARALGVATAADLADYWRMPVGEARPRLAELATAGELQQVAVEGWRQPAYLDPAARLPRRVAAGALLAPFDPLVWHRPRVARLFAFDYRLEIFVPAARRRWGTYVLPFLLGDRLVARVDLKADRRTRRLLVRGAWAEPGERRGRPAGPLAAELATLAAWLGLEGVTVARRGDLAAALAAACRGRRRLSR